VVSRQVDRALRTSGMFNHVSPPVFTLGACDGRDPNPFPFSENLRCAAGAEHRLLICEQAGAALLGPFLATLARRPHRCVPAALLIFCGLCVLQSPSLVRLGATWHHPLSSSPTPTPSSSFRAARGHDAAVPVAYDGSKRDDSGGRWVAMSDELRVHDSSWEARLPRRAMGRKAGSQLRHHMPAARCATLSRWTCV